LFGILPASRWPAEGKFTVRDMFQGLEHLEKVAGQISMEGVELTIAAINPESEAGIFACKRYLAPAFLDFGDVTLFAVVEAPIDTLECRDGRAFLKLGRPTVLRRAILPGDLEHNLAYLQAQLASARSDRMGVDLLHGALPNIPLLADAQ